MYKLSKTRIYIILAICLAGIFFAVPNVIGDKTKLPATCTGREQS